MPTAISMAELVRLARNARGVTLCFAGSPVAKAAPTGMQDIIRAAGQNSLGSTAGLTLVKNSAAFTAPVFDTTTSYERVGTQVNHYAVVKPTTSQDATHDSFYPGPGLHQKPPRTGRGKEFWDIPPDLSDLIRAGEQEHLNDALRAYELTYKYIADQINAMVGQKFGPAQTPAAANQMALDELGKRLPPQLGTNFGDWPKALDRLLGMTTKRDADLLHSLESDSWRQGNGGSIEKLRPSTFFGVNKYPSSKIVNL